ncbi:UNVERIFIED_CONTAM: S-layer family protein [Acetivibrio alkalicellulosi]
MQTIKKIIIYSVYILLILALPIGMYDKSNAFYNTEFNTATQISNRQNNYKDAYYEHLKDLVNIKTPSQAHLNINGNVRHINREALLIDIDGDGVPELITNISFILDSFNTRIHNKLTILKFNNGIIETLYSEEGWNNEEGCNDIYLAKDISTGEFYIIKIDIGYGQYIYEHLEIIKIDSRDIEPLRKYSFILHDNEEYYIDDIKVSEDIYIDSIKKEQLHRIKRIRLDSLSHTDKSIQKVLNSFNSNQIDFNSLPQKIYTVKDSRNFLGVNLNNIDYDVDKPDIVNVYPNGEIAGLSEGVANLQLIINNVEVVIPIIVKPKLEIDYGKIREGKKISGILEYLKELVTSSEPFYFQDNDTLIEIVRFINEGIKNTSIKPVGGSSNTVYITEKEIKPSIMEIERVIREIEAFLELHKIKLPREISTTITLEARRITQNKHVFLNLDKSILKETVNINYINIILGKLMITLEVNSLEKEFKSKDEVYIEIKPKDNSYEIIFTDKEGNKLKALENNINVCLPVENENPDFSVVFLNTGTNIEQIGGQYDSYNNVISFQTRLSGNYYIVENMKSYRDIEHLSGEMQEAIIFMTSKGYMIDRCDNIFDPDTEITREEFAALLISTFYMLDRTLTSSFSDVNKENEFYDYIASSEKQGIISGYPDNTFRGDQLINKEQMILICAKALHEKKQYLYPENPNEYLNYIDVKDISLWATKEIALAIREGLIVIPYDGMLNPKDTMSRGEAALMVYKLFQLLYEVSPAVPDEQSDSKSIVNLRLLIILLGIGLGLWLIKIQLSQNTCREI